MPAFDWAQAIANDANPQTLREPDCSPLRRGHARSVSSASPACRVVQVAGATPPRAGARVLLDFYTEVGATNAVLSGSGGDSHAKSGRVGLSATRWTALTGDRAFDRSGLRRRQC